AWLVAAALDGQDWDAIREHAGCMRLVDELLVGVGHGAGVATAAADVVDALHDKHPAHGGGTEHVAVEALERRRPEPDAEPGVPADTHVHYRHPRRVGVGAQATCERVGPAVVHVRGRAAAVGDRVAQAHDRTG